MARLFERICVNFTFAFALPKSAGKQGHGGNQDHEQTGRHRPQRMHETRARQRSAAPRKNPAPFNAFFDPVSSATHLNKTECASSGTTSLMALFELILVRSLAMPDSPCAATTKATAMAFLPVRIERGEHVEGPGLQAQTAIERELEAEPRPDPTRQRGS